LGPEGSLLKVKVELFLVCDLAALCKLLGLTSVYHPRAVWKCAWCEAMVNDLGDFTKDSWPLRNFFTKSYEDMAEHATKLKQPRAYARTHKGIMVSVSFNKK
jgi:hypothetical protein